MSPLHQKQFDKQSTWWAWILPVTPLVVVAAISALSAKFHWATPCLLHIPLAMVLIQFWGPRILPAMLLSSSVYFIIWGQSEPYWLAHAFVLLEMIEVLASWLLYRKVLGGGPIIDNLRSLWRYFVVALALPIALGTYLKIILLSQTGAISEEQGSLSVISVALSHVLVSAALVAPALTLITPFLGRRKLLIPPVKVKLESLPKPVNPMEAAEMLAVSLIVLILLLLHRVEEPLLKSLTLPAILSFYITLRHGIMAVFPLLFILSFVAINDSRLPQSDNMVAQLNIVTYRFDLVLYGLTIMLMGRLVSDQRSDARARLNAQLQVQAVFDASSARILVFGPDGQIKQMNRAASNDFSQYSCLSEIYDATLEWDEFGNPIQREDRPVIRAMQSGESFREIVLGVQDKRTGDFRWIMANIETIASVIPQTGPDCLVVFLDITQKYQNQIDSQKMHERLRRAQKNESLGMMAAGIAHNFNNLLAVIQGNIDLARMEHTQPAESTLYLRQASVAATRAAELTDQLLTFTGQNQMLIEPVPLNLLLNELVQDLWAKLHHGATIMFKPDGSDPVALADAHHLRLMIEALVANATEAADKRGVNIVIHTATVTIGTPIPQRWQHSITNTEPGEYCWLTISDNGPGMSKDVLGQIFDPFFTTRENSRGLGMAMVLGVVRGHKGSIKIQSSQGKGCTIDILIPIATSDETSDNTEQWKNIFCGTALLADSDPQSRQQLVYTLSELGLETLIASDGLEAAEIFERDQQSIDLVILDVATPIADPAQVFHMIRANRRDIPVVISAHDMTPDMKKRFAGLDIIDHIPKSASPERLLEMLNKAIPGHRSSPRTISGD